DLHEPGNWNEYCFLRLTDPNARTAIESVLNLQLEKGHFQLVPLYTLHYHSDLHLNDSFRPTTETGKTRILLFISLVILLIAGINFTNLYAALCPLRIRSLNTQKVLGSTRRKLTANLVAESTAVCAGAWLVSLPLTGLADRLGIGELLQTSIRLSGYPGLLLLSLLMALTIGLLSGLGPALYATSFQPALVLKGNFGLSPKGRNLRNLLIGMQFTVVFTLFIYVLNIYQQHLYMRHSELGYHKERLINITMDKLNRDGNGTAYADGLKQLAAVEEVAFSYDRLSSTESGRSQWGRSLDNDDLILFHVIQVSDNFLRTAGIAVTEGNDFTPTDAGSFIFNETARRNFGNLHLGAFINGDSRVVGFCTDFKFGHLHGEIEPLALVCNSQWLPYYPYYLVVRIREGIPPEKALQDIRTYTRNFVQNPDLEPEILTQLDVMDITYEKENRWMTSIVIFCALAIFICLTGVFGLTVFECEYRRKEIGIRKVLGADTGDIIAMLCRRYVWMMAVSFAIAAPVAWYASHQWLQEFAYRTEILPRTFFIPLLAIAAVTLLTVVLQSYRTAHANPADSLRAE
ncbi:MAG: FtsX-like permease family protein, partial [Paraprevotella sp.]|nr:FtsX-like permease family protein [Paraprevotella sp.]